MQRLTGVTVIAALALISGTFSCAAAVSCCNRACARRLAARNSPSPGGFYSVRCQRVSVCA